ncbi:hypothetical protein BCR35DRAFT_354847 [Leucosporidium creatinivorum]|uniref:Alcohol acetyltransferase n=1 Tax=Leucosporidium creatinivorum TaxID=106004 RepID=A0A1Y2E5G3_9BASI|nr:hypothetical protein BCR35DRAFT_354847 [Leucosporidium creatinivorum]
MALTRLVPRSDFWQLALLSLGHPSVIAFHASLPPSASNLTQATAERAASHLLAKYPLLRCGLERPQDAPPSLRMRQTVVPSEVVKVETQKAEETLARTSTDLLSRALEEGWRFQWDAGPLWRVQMVGGRADGAWKATRLVLSIAHLISDGIGARRLFGELLSLLKSNEKPLPTTNLTFPPIRDGLDCFTPPSAFVELGNNLTSNAAYPHRALPSVLPYSSRPPTLPSRTVVKELATLSPSVVAALKAQAKANGVDTLQPLLHGTALAALSLAFTSPSSKETFTLKSFTDVSFRNEQLSHPPATGSYAFSIPTHRWRCYTHFPFWVLCRWYQQELLDESLREDAAWEAGYDWRKGEGNHFVYGVDEMVERTKRDMESGGGWCWSTTAATSNLGVMDETGWEGELGDVCWAQTAVPGCSAVLMNALSARQGDLSITAVWRAGTLEEDRMELFNHYFNSIIDAVARGGVGAMTEMEEFRR